MSQASEDIANTPVAASAMPSDQSFQPGQVVVGKYKILSLLGRGGIGSVYKVEQVFLGQHFALKTLNSQTASDQLIRRFQNEARAASSLSHPNLVKVIDFGLVKGQHPYLVMDFVDGITLSEYLKENGLFNLEQAVGCFARVCLGLSYAHDQGIVHRDIKPSNIMISRSLPFGAEGFVKVVDFGIAKVVSAEDGELQSLTATGEIFGSPLYMSPEQCSGAAVDHRADIYSLGCVIFESLTGTSPFVGQNALSTMMLHQSEKAPTLKEASLGKEFPPALEHVVAKLLAKAPADRYQNLGIVANDLAQIVKGAPLLGISPASKKEIKADVPVKMTLREFRKWLAVTALGVALASVAIGYFGAQWLAEMRAGEWLSQLQQTSKFEASEAQLKQSETKEQDRAFAELDTAVAGSGHHDLFGEEYKAVRMLAETAGVGNVSENTKALERLQKLYAVVLKDRVLENTYRSGLEERIAFCHAKLKRYSKAEEYLQKAMKSAFKDDAKKYIGQTYEYMAEEVKHKGNFKKALDYRYAAAQAFSEMCKIDGIDPKQAADAARAAGEDYRNCAAICFENFNDCSKTVAYCFSAKQMFSLAHDEYKEGMLYMLHGAALTRLNRPDEAKHTLEKSIKLLKRSKLDKSVNDAPLYVSSSYQQLSVIALLSNDYETARLNYFKARKELLSYKPISAFNKQRRKDALFIVAESLKNLPQKDAVK